MERRLNQALIPKYVLNLFQEGSEKDSEEENQSNAQDEVRKSICIIYKLNGKSNLLSMECLLYRPIIASIIKLR